MAKTIISFSFDAEGGTGYLLDIGVEKSLKARFVLPPDKTQTDAASIVTAAGGTLIQSDVPCSEGSNIKPRKLVFIRASGNSVGVPISSRADLLSAATTIKGVLGDVVCIKLEGEEVGTLNDELGVNLVSNAPSSKPTAGDKQPFYSGLIAYSTDAVSGNAIFTPIKVATDVEDQPPTSVSTAWTDCVGDFVDSGFSCGSAAKREHRRFLLDLRVTQGGVLVAERKEVPCKDYGPSDIKTCGEALAALQGVFCIGYRGESYGFFHKLVP